MKFTARISEDIRRIKVQ